MVGLEAHKAKANAKRTTGRYGRSKKSRHGMRAKPQ